jgi:GT2 family glycosyltransferase
MKKHQKSGGWIFERCLELCCISPSSVMIKRELLDALGDFDESLPACEDYDLWLQICSREPVLYVPTPLINKYGGHDDQLSRLHPAMDRFRIKALEKIASALDIPEDKRQMARLEIKKRLEILIIGARKRGNAQWLDTFEAQLGEVQAALNTGARP